MDMNVKCFNKKVDVCIHDIILNLRSRWIFKHENQTFFIWNMKFLIDVNF